MFMYIYIYIYIFISIYTDGLEARMREQITKISESPTVRMRRMLELECRYMVSF